MARHSIGKKIPIKKRITDVNTPSSGSFTHSAVWVREVLHENKLLLQSARANTSECITIKPPKEIFDAIVADMLSKKSS